MTNEELWKDVTGYEGLYQVSNLGRVRKIVEGGFKYIAHPSDGRIEFWKDGVRSKRVSIKKLLLDEFGIQSNPGEEWKDLEDFPDYKISNHGRLINTKTGHFVNSAPGITISKTVVNIFGLTFEDGENWEDIVGCESYQVSDQGRVRNKETGRILKLSQVNKSKKYLKVALPRYGKWKFYLVHRLVAEAFIPNPDPEHLTQVNHRDEDPTNNRVDNLEWCDAKYNINYGTRIQRISETFERKRKSKLDKCRNEEERQKVLKAQDYADASRRYYWKHKN